jgi:hypothetical protein
MAERPEYTVCPQDQTVGRNAAAPTKALQTQWHNNGATVLKKTYKEKEHDAKAGKRRFLERVAQEQDADEEIANYREEDCNENSTHQRNPD